MSNSFWLALIALTALALAFILYPLFFTSRAQRRHSDRHAQNLANYRQRLGELEADRAADLIDEGTFATLKEELDAALLEDVQGDGTSHRSLPPREGRGPVIAVAGLGLIAVPLLAFFLYHSWGAREALVQAQTMREITADGTTSRAEVEQMLAQLRRHLEAEPANAEGWALLGRTNMRLERYEQAAEAYRALAGQLGDSPVAATAWGLTAQARFMAQQGEWNESIQSAVEEARRRNPDEVNALGLLGIASFEAEDYQQAAEYWARIIEVVPDHPQRASIVAGVQRAYDAMDKPMPASVRELIQNDSATATSTGANEGSESVAGAASVRVRVTLSETLPPLQDDATVFVFARAVDGPAMPLAVKRLRVSDLPATVTLDDSAAMMANASLSTANQVVLGARVSLSGSATPSTGDYEGFSQPLAVGDDMGTVSLVIDQRRP